MVTERITRLYSNNNTVVVVNNVAGKSFPNMRGSLRQGDIPSMFWFAIGIDPLLVYLEKRLTGIPITSLPVSGPTEEHVKERVLPPAQQLYKLVAYADDVKQAISNMSEFNLIDNACTLLEKRLGLSYIGIQLQVK